MPTRIQTFLFAPIRTDTVRIFAALTAAMLLLNFRYWDPYTGSYFVTALQPWHNLTGSHFYRGALLLLTIAFALGLRPRWSGMALLVLLVPLAGEPVLAQSRQILLFTLFCLSLLDGGAAKHPLPAWPIRLIQLQLSIVYAINALAKMSPAYLSGDVLVAMSMTLSNFLVDMSDGFYRAGPLAIPAAAAAWASVIVESFLAVGFWFRPLRWTTAIIGLLFHLQLKTIIQIGMLDWASMFLYLAFMLPLYRDR